MFVFILVNQRLKDQKKSFRAFGFGKGIWIGINRNFNKVRVISMTMTRIKIIFRFQQDFFLKKKQWVKHFQTPFDTTIMNTNLSWLFFILSTNLSYIFYSWRAIKIIARQLWCTQKKLYQSNIYYSAYEGKLIFDIDTYLVFHL